MATQNIDFGLSDIDGVTFNGQDVKELVFDGKLLWNGISYDYPSELLVTDYTDWYSDQSNGLNGTYNRSHASWRIRNGEWIGGFNGRPFWTRDLGSDWHSLIYWCPGDSAWKLDGPFIGGLGAIDDHLENIGNIDSSEGIDWLKCGSSYKGSTVDKWGTDPGPISPELGAWFRQKYSGSGASGVNMPLISDTPFFVYAV